MEERELSQRIKALTKAVQAQEPAANVLLLLETIKKESSPTEEQLRSTKAGLTIGKLRSNSNKDIARLSTEIVSKWKANIDKAKKARSSMATTPTAASTPKSVASPLPPATTYNKPYEGDPEKRHFKTDKVDTKRYKDNETRNGSIGVLYNGLSYRSTEPIDAVLAKAIEVEAAVNKIYTDKARYAARVRCLFTVLKRKDNRKLGLDVMAGNHTPEDFVKMSDEQLASEQQRARDAQLEKENLMNAQVAQPEKSVSDALKCGKCGERKVSYTQAQTRSADEPMTTFCECMHCGNRWKFS